MEIKCFCPNGDINFTAIENVNPVLYLKKTQEILDKFGYKWFVAFGTALGLYPDTDFIPRDTDIDIAILADGYEFEEMTEEFLKYYKAVRIVEDEKRYQICFQGEDDFIIDICFFYRDGDEYYTKTPQGQFRDKVDVIGNLVGIKTKYGTLPFPEKTKEYMIARYGDDWLTPKYGATGTSIKV